MSTDKEPRSSEQIEPQALTPYEQGLLLGPQPPDDLPAAEVAKVRALLRPSRVSSEGTSASQPLTADERAALAATVERTCAEQGVEYPLTDPVRLRRVAEIIGPWMDEREQKRRNEDGLGHTSGKAFAAGAEDARGERPLTRGRVSS